MLSKALRAKRITYTPAMLSFLLTFYMYTVLAASTNLGGLFAARAADRSREVALRLALGAKRARILRTLFTESLLISLAGGTLGLWGSVVLLHGLSAWQPVPRYPISVPVNPDANVYAVALVLALVSRLLFGASFPCARYSGLLLIKSLKPDQPAR